MDYRGAIQDLNKGISLKSDGDMYYLRGFSKLAMQNYPEAIKDFNKAIELTPSNDMAIIAGGTAIACGASQLTPVNTSQWLWLILTKLFN